VSVVDIQFSPLPEQPAGVTATAPATNLPAFDVMRIAELGALAAIAIALIWFVLRPLMAGGAPTQLPAPAAPQQTAMTNTAPVPDTLEYHPEPSKFDQHIDLAQVQGQVRASSINKVADIVKAHADESAGLLRSWMREAS